MDIADRSPLSPFVWTVTVTVTSIVLATAGRYGIFRDEYYYLMCAGHPAWGYVDHPPLAMIFLGLWTDVFGASAIALRVPVALLVGLSALGAALIAREMRGGAASQVLATVTVGLMPGVLALGGFYSMNAFDVAFWILAAWIVCRLLDPASDRRWWWALGVAFGLGLLNKYSLAFLGVGLAVGILLSPLRRELLSWQRLVGSLVVVAIVAPHVVWQGRNGWPTVEFIRNAHNLKNVAMAPGEFWGEQLLMAHPLYLPLWAAGFVGLLLLPRLRPWRPLGTAFVVVGLIFTLSNAKPYYLVPAYPMLLAAGAIVVTDWLARFRRLSLVMAVTLPVLAFAGGLVTAPLAIPLLSPKGYVEWERTLGLRPKNMENNAVGDLPQHFADRFGWWQLADAVRTVTAQLSPAERAQTLVVAGNYGECGAINYWGLPAGLRPAVSGHNSCYTWWPARFVPEIVVLVGGSRERAQQMFTSVELVAVSRSELAMPYEREIPIWVCRGWKVDPATAREQARFAI